MSFKYLYTEILSSFKLHLLIFSGESFFFQHPNYLDMNEKDFFTMKCFNIVLNFIFTIL